MQDLFKIIFEFFFLLLWRAYLNIYLYMFWLHGHLPSKKAKISKKSAKGYERINWDILRRSGYFNPSSVVTCNDNIHSKTTFRLVLFLIKYKKINLLNQMYIFQFHHSMSGSSALHPLTFNGSGRRPRRLQARPPPCRHFVKDSKTAWTTSWKTTIYHLIPSYFSTTSPTSNCKMC